MWAGNISCVIMCFVWTVSLIRISLRCDLPVQMNYPTLYWNDEMALFSIKMGHLHQKNPQCQNNTKKRGAIANILIISGSQAHFTPLELYNSFIWKQNENAIINHYKSEISHLKIGEVTIYQVIYTGSTIFMLVSKNQTFHKSIKRACSWNFNANQVIKLTHTHGHILTHAECARGKSEQTSKSEKIRYSIIVCASGMMLVICCRQLKTVPATATRESEWCRRNIIESI